MTAHLPLGKTEGERLEFKGVDALKNLDRVAGSAVAMLNSEGGEIWIGVREANELAVGIEDVPRPELEARRLGDHLVDVVEPAPNNEELRIDIVRDETNQAVLHILLSPVENRRPYAFVRDRAREFVVRVGARSRPMTREEIREAFLGTKRKASRVAKDALTLSRARVQKEQDAELQRAGSHVWIRLQPVPSLTLDVEEEKLALLLRDPAASNNRRAGWNFTNRFQEVRLDVDRILIGEGTSRIAWIQQDGGIGCRADLERLHHSERPKEIHPLALLELVVSVFRLMKTLIAWPCAGSTTEIVSAIALVNRDGWKLPAYPPGTSGYLTGYGASDVREVSSVFTADLPAYEADRVAERPDECAYRLVKLVFRAFGLPVERIPWQYDRDKGRLLLSD